MSNNVLNQPSNSRSNSISESTENEISFYATPKPDTPFATPCSTPRLIHCRLNPVKTIRQHVPLKINFSREAHCPTSDHVTSSTFNDVKPMNTKKVKCVIQANPLYQDGDGDHPVETNSKPVPFLNEYGNDSVKSHCHPEGDTELVAQPGNATNDNQLADNPQPVAVIEREIEKMDRFVKDSIERLQKSCDIKTNSDGCDVMSTANHCDYNNKGEKSKRDEKCNPENKNICVQAGHKCEKKKFYDPEDIRKYMMKKKTERQAKEKEERHKKESEAKALKKKTEATKSLVSKTRIPVLRSQHTNEPEVQTENLGKGSRRAKSSSFGPKMAEELKISRRSFLNEKKIECQRRNSKALSNNDNTERRETSCKNENTLDSSNKNVVPTALSEKLPLADLNYIVNQPVERNRMTSAPDAAALIEKDLLKMTFTKPKTSENKTRMKASCLPEELDVLKSKNPYNFLNILKGKVNLAKNSVDANNKQLSEDNLLSEAFSSSQFTKNLDGDQFLEDIIKRRIKIGSPATVAMKLSDVKTDEESENVEPSNNFAEPLPLRSNQTFRIWPSGKNDKTYTVLDNVDKSNVNVISDKNLSLDISGIKSLSSPDKKNSKKLFRKAELSVSQMKATNDSLSSGAVETNLDRTLTLESLQAHNISLSLPDSFIKKDGKESNELSLKKLSVDVGSKLLEDESIFRSGIAKGDDTSSVIGKVAEKISSCSSQNFGMNESSIFSSDDLTNLSTTAVFLDIYDQMINTEDEKLSQILRKIHQQKEALNKYLKTEVFSLESKKNVYRENKDDEKIKAIKKRQRAILLKITKNIQELEKMKKSVIETVERRKNEILRQKSTMKEKKEFLKQKFSSPKKRKSDSNKTFLISKQSNTLFMGISSSSSTSVLLENIENGIQEQAEKEFENSTENTVALNKNRGKKDTATSPVNFNTGISIKFELDPDKLLRMKDVGEIKIDPLQFEKEIGKGQHLAHRDTTDADYSLLVNEREKSDRNSSKMKIKRPLSPVVLPVTKKVSQMRRLSSSSDVTFASINETTTDQSDVELRISALQEQLRQRKLEADKLRKEEKQLRKERLRAKEQSLIKQLDAYDQYIQKVSKMLSEDRSITEIAKPLIKPVTKRPSFAEPSDKNKTSSNFNEPFNVSNNDERISAKNKIYDDMDGENTEDSEKHLRKADSGILMESEVTEVSENVEIRKSKSESEINSNVKSDRIAEKFTAEEKPATSSKSMDNFLQLINDIQSEVVSMSEQVYSSDFVEDIPEDIPDSKSEISENAANYSSISIEEILSDRQYHSDNEPKSVLSEDSVKKCDSSKAEFSTELEPNEKDVQKGKLEESDLSDVFVVRNISDIESSTFEREKPPVTSSEKVFTEDKVKQHSVDEDLQTENTLKNNVVDLSPLGELKIMSSQNTVSELSSAEEIQTASSLKNILNEDDPIEKIKPRSPSKTPLTDVGEDSVFIDFSQVDNSGDVKSALNEEFFKYESEGSCVADVDEPVRKTDDIQTMMDGLEFSPQNNNFTQSEDFPSINAEQNFDEVFNHMESYFSMKITSVNDMDEFKPSYDYDLEKKDLELVLTEQKVQRDENTASVKVLEIGLEETDISESLEYDTTPTENSSSQKYNIHCTFSEKNKVVETKPRFDNEPSKTHSESEHAVVQIAKKCPDELSAEEDRSVEEFLEDYSIPNLGTTTFIVNEDSESEVDQQIVNKTSSLSTVESVSEAHSRVDEQVEDFDQKINVDQTPFLEALRRERETLFGQKQEVFENITSELIDKLLDENYVNTLDEITKNVDSDSDTKGKVNDNVNETATNKTDIKVDEDTVKKNNKISNDWLDKELNFNRERLREAEELRLQQMRIEQEIEELQAQQHIPPYLYLREIPNKPPPPYTPPSEQNSVRIPQNEAELQSLINPAILYVCKSLKKCAKIDDIKQLPEYTPNGKSNTEITTYKKFIFDLIKEVVRNILENSKTKTCLPWESLSKHRKPKLPLKEEDLPALIENEILVLFGFRSKINKEKLIIQWSRKKRNDFVDDLLIKELQDEEAEWKNYEEDENIIKNQITQNLLDDLIQDTVDSLRDAFNAKN